MLRKAHEAFVKFLKNRYNQVLEEKPHLKDEANVSELLQTLNNEEDQVR